MHEEACPRCGRKSGYVAREFDRTCRACLRIVKHERAAAAWVEETWGKTRSNNDAD